MERQTADRHTGDAGPRYHRRRHGRSYLTLNDVISYMSAESREKAQRNGQKSGKGTEILSKAIDKVTGDGEDDED